MEQALGKQGITKQEKVLDPKNRIHADSVLREYERIIKEIVYSKFKGATDVQREDREDVIIDVCYAFWEMLHRGGFTGEHEEASIIACISTIAKNKKDDFLRWLIAQKKFQAWEPKIPDNKPGGSTPDGADPGLASLPYPKPLLGFGDPVRMYEKKEMDRFITIETKYPEIIDSFKKGYSMIEIARKLGLKDKQVNKRIEREIKRLAEKAKQQGWLYKN